MENLPILKEIGSVLLNNADKLSDFTLTGIQVFRRIFQFAFGILDQWNGFSKPKPAKIDGASTLLYNFQQPLTIDKLINGGGGDDASADYQQEPTTNDEVSLTNVIPNQYGDYNNEELQQLLASLDY